jgi:glycosyltransferase involved in cell wall biosynthesis
MSADPVVCILLATHDGADHLPEQLASLAQQRYRRWALVAADDASTDGTAELLRRVAAREAIEIRALLELGPARAGPKATFDQLGRHARDTSFDYFAFCDQDDLWDPKKLQLQVRRLLALEQRHPGRPVLVYSDCTVVDRDGAALAGSFNRYAGIREPPAHDALRALVRYNPIPGNTMLFNRRLLELAFPLPPEAWLHDWWTALVASALGAIGHVPHPLVAYRQHGRNTIGARRPLSGLRAAFVGYRAGGRAYCATFRQASALLGRAEAAGTPLPGERACFVAGFAALPGRPRTSRLQWVLGSRMRHPNRLGAIAFWVRMLQLRCDEPIAASDRHPEDTLIQQ